MRSSAKMFAIGVVLVIACLTIAGSIAFSREPFINTNQGDLLLFIFALAGGVSGFVAGYYWRRLTTEKTGKRGVASRV